MIAIGSIWRLNLDGGIALYNPLTIISPLILLFSVIGLFVVIKKKLFIILAPVLTGLFLWWFYSLSSFFIVIDYARVVVITSILLVMLSGFGFQETAKVIMKRYPKIVNNKVVFYFKIIAIALFIVLSLSYTDNSNWQRLVLKISNSDLVLLPAPPATNYLQNNDIFLFKEISGTRFLSHPWKGLVVGAATNNYPLNTKDSIVSTKFLYYNDFMNKSCDGKRLDAEKNKIQYIYSYQFNCDGFNDIGVSSENFYLYKFNFQK